jgi:UPF0716 protein FxsA
MNPFAVLFLLLLLVPLVELYVLIQVGQVIGAIPTIALVVFTALLGALLLRFQGWTTLQRARLTMAHGELPALEVMEGVLLMLSGILLLTPGFFTDTIGFLLLVPVLRQALVRAFMRRAQVPPGGAGDRRDPQPRGPRTIEGEYRREDD